MLLLSLVKMDETILITNYIAAWGYQILAIMSLFFSFMFLTISTSVMAGAFYIALFFIFVFCEYKSFKKRQEVIGEK